MPLPVRRALAALGVLVFLAAYVWGVIALGDRLPDIWWVKVLYFAVAGAFWGIPLLPLLSWAEGGGRPPRQSPPAAREDGPRPRRPRRGARP